MRRSVVLATSLVIFGAVTGTCSSAAMAQGVLQANDILARLKPGQARGIKAIAVPDAEAPAAVAAPVRTAAARPAPAPAAEPPAATGSVDLDIPFASGSAELMPRALRQLDELGRALSSSDLKSVPFRIEGHTDTTGDRATNQELSERRAKVVSGYLASHFPLDPAHLQAIGKGEDDPAVPTPDQTDEPRNRRVRIVRANG